MSFPCSVRVVASLLAVATSLAAGPARAGSFDLVSIGDDGSLPTSHYSGDHAAISADGRYVAFRSSEAGLVTPATSGYQVFLRDRLLQTTELVSADDLGAPGNGASDWPSVSSDGCRIAFQSDASNLVPGDQNGVTDVFVRDRCASALPTTSLASVDSAGTHSTGQSMHPAISASGRVVAFWAYGADLVPTAPHPGQIYVRDLDAHTTILISDNSTQDGKGGNFGSDCPSVSDDGSRVAFWSQAYDLVAGDDHTVWDVFVWDAGATPRIARVSTSSAGVPQNLGGNGVSSVTWPAISGDGRYVAWVSDSTNLVPGDTNGVADVFVKDTALGGVQRASVTSAGAQLAASSGGQRPALSGDGSWVAFNTSAADVAPETGGVYPTIVLHNLATGETRGVAAAASSDDPALSHDPNGAYLAVYLGAPLDTAHPASGVFACSRNGPPVAVAALSASTPAPHVGEPVILDGSGSSDPDGDALSFRWSQLAGPATVSFDSPVIAAPSFTPSVAGSYQFQLVVSDASADSNPALVTFDVTDASSAAPQGASGCSAAGGAASVWALVPLLGWPRRRRVRS
jgi:Tol biopolymer transport system component